MSEGDRFIGMRVSDIRVDAAVPEPAPDRDREWRRHWGEKIEAARKHLMHDGSTWRHQGNGNIYKVEGVRLDCSTQTDGRLLIDYQDVDPSKRMPLSRPYEEWEQIVKVGEGLSQQGVPRFIRVQRISRYETEAEIAQRG
jgi:hypothetical protein